MNDKTQKELIETLKAISRNLAKISKSLDIISDCVYTRRHGEDGVEIYFHTGGWMDTYEQN